MGELAQSGGWWGRLDSSGRPQFAPDVETMLPNRVILVSSYHPSRQNTNTGRLTRPMWYSVFQRIRTILA